MLLQKIKLNNIRSYLDETINFVKGSTLLSGDIGCGKSTILLATEFALFGTSRPDLPGEALLRKGTSNGSVELHFQINGQDMIIKRSLKKEKEIIKQISGYLIINGIKKDLTPVELKAEMISLLGYPEEFITKNKNYIFRYTVYTPQEEMKLILQENPELRLDVLRKIFNIDKYKNVRENLQTHLKEMRTEIAILKTKTETLEEKKSELEELNGNIKNIKEKMETLMPLLNSSKEQLINKKNRIEKIEKQQQEFLELKQKYKTVLTLINEKNNQQQILTEKSEQINLQLAKFSLPEEITEIQIKEEIKEIENQKIKLLQQKSILTEKITNLQQKINEGQKEIKEINEKLTQIEDLKKLKDTLIDELAQKEELKIKSQQLQELDLKTTELITKNETLLHQSKDLEQKILKLDNCPTCLQNVSEIHKLKIKTEEEEKIKKAENLLFELKKKKMEIVKQKDEINVRIEELIKKENLLTRTKLEIIQLEEKKEQIEIKRSGLKNWVQENNQLMQQLDELVKENLIAEYNQKLSHQQKIILELANKKYLTEELEKLKKQFAQQDLEIKDLNENLQLYENSLAGKEDCQEKLNTEKKEMEDISIKEKELAIKSAQLNTNLDNLISQEKKLTEIVDKLITDKNKLTRAKELYHWLEQYFLKLTYTIEKQVMLNIHNLFNQLFQEWFAILIDDDEIHARIDDSFNPIIEQNGYEISFANLSGGEKTSASLAYRLALNRVINDVIHDIKTKELLILDEPTDGFSSEQLDKVRDVLEKLKLQQTLIVSHENKIESFVETIIRVHKEGHVSKVL